MQLSFNIFQLSLTWDPIKTSCIKLCRDMHKFDLLEKSLEIVSSPRLVVVSLSFYLNETRFSVSFLTIHK